MNLPNEYAIKTFNLTKVYGDNEVLSNVNINIKKGEIYGFLGPNGSGKTTTMKLLMGFIKPINGKIEILGKDLENNLYKILENIGSMIERPIFYENMTAVENMKLHLDYFGYSNENTIEESLKKVNLVNVENKKVKKFSQGMKQRLALARAISTKPEILILDEPINGLDPVGVKEIRSLLLSLCKENGVTIFISSHILSELEQIANTIGVLNKGKLLKEVSMDYIREETLDYIEFVVDDLKKASYVSNELLKINNFKVVGNSIRIYEKTIAKSTILEQFVLNGVKIISMDDKRDSLEKYFLNLLDRSNKENDKIN